MDNIGNKYQEKGEYAVFKESNFLFFSCECLLTAGFGVKSL